MKAGALDRRIIIQSSTQTVDQYGAPRYIWSDVATVWAQYLPGGGDERYSPGQIYAQTDARFRIRYRSDITPLNRIVYNGRIYDILAIEEEGRRVGLVIKAKARGE